MLKRAMFASLFALTAAGVVAIAPASTLGAASAKTDKAAKPGKTPDAAAKPGTVKAEGLTAVRARFLADLQKYVKDNPKAADIGDATVDLVQTAKTIGDFGAVKAAAKDFLKNHGDNSQAGNVRETYVDSMIASGNIADVKDAIDTLADAPARSQIGALTALATLCAVSGDMKGFDAAWERALAFPELKQANPRGPTAYEQYAGMRDKQKEAIGKPFEHFDVKDIDGKELKTAGYKGKIILVDFWATWCGPCIGELPNVLRAYNDFHAKGFEVVGVSLDQDEDKLRDFIKERGMPWPQHCDYKGWESALAAEFGVKSIPHTVLIDREGKVLAQGIRGEALEGALRILMAGK